MFPVGAAKYVLVFKALVVREIKEGCIAGGEFYVVSAGGMNLLNVLTGVFLSVSVVCQF